MLGSRYMLGAQIGDSVKVTYVHEEWEGRWRHRYKVIVKHLDTKCATCGFTLGECICDDPAV